MELNTTNPIEKLVKYDEGKADNFFILLHKLFDINYFLLSYPIHNFVLFIDFLNNLNTVLTKYKK